ncbi:hypothetical protein D3C84_518190 [compost metagenome]
MLIAQHRCQATEQRHVGQQNVEVERNLRNPDTITPCRDGRMQVAQRLTILHPVDLRHHTCEQVEDALGLGDEGREALAPVHAGRRGVFIDQLGGTGMRLLGR